MRSDLLDAVAGVDLSHSIFCTIRRNLIWACVYNSVMPDEVDAMSSQESVWMTVRAAVGDGWDAVRERLHIGTARGYAQVNTDESV
ncbi:hypothetical protein EI94DRAFT_1757115 [Lactarius quietus]|nr:hypothetical protein EI94DRAFT_1757115 [Lactarius quietus]